MASLQIHTAARFTPVSPRPSRLLWAAQRALSALWLGVIPALLAWLVVRDGLAARLTLPVGIALFFVLAAVVRYWRFRIPGGRYASPLPAHLVPGEKNGDLLSAWAEHAAAYERLTSSGMRALVKRRLGVAEREAFEARTAELGAALEDGDAPAAATAIRAAEDIAVDALRDRRRRDLLALGGVAAAACAAALGVRAEVVQPYRVLSASMLPTLEPGDLLAGNRLAPRAFAGPPSTARSDEALPARGDVVVFRSDRVAIGPQAVPELLVKRVIGLPGDRISMRGGVPVINGWVTPSCDAGPYMYVAPDSDPVAIRGRLRVEFLGDRAYLTLHSMSRAFEEPFVVPAGELFVLGDNRSNSLDSRAWNDHRGGGVPRDAIDARADRFLIGSHRRGDSDLTRLFRPLDALERSLHVEGLDSRSVEEGVARCLATRPATTIPPAPPIGGAP